MNIFFKNIHNTTCRLRVSTTTPKTKNKIRIKKNVLLYKKEPYLKRTMISGLQTFQTFCENAIKRTLRITTKVLVIDSSF